MNIAREWGIAKLPETLTLTCDNPACNTEICEVPHAEMRAWLNFPCPYCNENMLTEEDLRDTQRFIHVVEWCNRWLGWLGYLFPRRETVSIRPHRGDLNVKKEAE